MMKGPSQYVTYFGRMHGRKNIQSCQILIKPFLVAWIWPKRHLFSLSSVKRAPKQA